MASSFYAEATDTPDSNGAGGAGFGLNLVALVRPGIHWYNITGAEVDFDIEAGGSAQLKSGLSIAASSTDTIQATDFDCGLSISSAHPTLGLRHGILFSYYNGHQPGRADGTLIGTAGAQTVLNEVDFSSYSFAGSAFKSQGFGVNGEGDLALASVSITGSLAGFDGTVPGRSALIGWNASNGAGEVAYINTDATAQNAHEWYQQGANGSLTALGGVDVSGNWTFPESVITGLLVLNAAKAAHLAWDDATNKLVYSLGGVRLASWDSAGNCTIKGSLTQSGTP